MRLIILFLVFGSLGCQTITLKCEGDSRPYIEHKSLYDLPGWKAKQNKAIFSDEQVAQYLDCFLETWQARGLPGTTEEISKYFDRIELHWQPTRFTNPEGDPDSLLLGYMINRSFKKKVSVFVYDGSQQREPRLGHTALGHELIHVSLLAVSGTAQSNHFMASTSKWSIIFQDLEDEVNAKFQ